MAAADAMLAAQLGVRPEAVVRLRRLLEEGQDWTRDAIGKVHFTGTGVAKVKAALGGQCAHSGECLVGFVWVGTAGSAEQLSMRLALARLGPTVRAETTFTL